MDYSLRIIDHTIYLNEYLIFYIINFKFIFEIESKRNYLIFIILIKAKMKYP